MTMFFSLELEIKNRIRELLAEKKLKKAHVSLKMGYNKNFLSYFLGQKGKFFNLEHIQKFCAALDYPVWKLVYEAIQEPGGILGVAESQPPPYGTLTAEEREWIHRLRGLTSEQQKLIVELMDSWEQKEEAAGEKIISAGT